MSISLPTQNEASCALAAAAFASLSCHYWRYLKAISGSNLCVYQQQNHAGLDIMSASCPALDRLAFLANLMHHMQAACRPWPEYNRESPAPSSLSSAVLAASAEQVELAEEDMSRTSAKIFRIDHSFKLPKHFSAQSRGQATAVLSCINEQGKVVGWYGTETSSLAEVETPFKAFHSRCERMTGLVRSRAPI